MVKIEDDKIKIYSKIDKSKLKLSMILFGMCIFIILLCCLLMRRLLLMILAIFPVIILIIAVYLYLKKDDEKLRYSLSKEYFIIYKNNKEIKYNCSDITSFATVNTNGNNIYLNYLDSNGKKRSKVINLIGCEKMKFVNLANEILRNNIDLDNKNNVAKEEYTIKETSKVFDELKRNNEKIKCTLIGKSKMFIFNGNSYSLERFYNILFFVTDNKEIIKIDLRGIDINLDELDLNTKYELSYYREKDILLASKLEEPIDTEMIDNLRNSVDYVADLCFEKQQIIDEIELLHKIDKINNILKVLILISLVSILFSIRIFCIIFLVMICIFYPCLLVSCISRYKKKHDM